MCIRDSYSTMVSNCPVLLVPLLAFPPAPCMNEVLAHRLKQQDDRFEQLEEHAWRLKRGLHEGLDRCLHLGCFGPVSNQFNQSISWRPWAKRPMAKHPSSHGQENFEYRKPSYLAAHVFLG